MWRNGCVQPVWFVQNSTLTTRRTCIIHKHAIITHILYKLEKVIYGLKKTSQLWNTFRRIVSLFLITWHTFNQSMNKNIWMLFIISNRVLCMDCGTLLLFNNFNIIFNWRFQRSTWDCLMIWTIACKLRNPGEYVKCTGTEYGRHTWHKLVLAVCKVSMNIIKMCVVFVFLCTNENKTTQHIVKLV